MQGQSPPRPLRLAQRSGPGRYGALGTARLINCYCEQQVDGKIEWPIVVSPGLTQYIDVTLDGCRGLFKIDETLALAVFGIDIIEIASNGTWRVVGGIPGTGYCYFARNRKPAGTQVAIISDGNKRCYDAVAGTVVTITDSDLPSTTVGCDAISAYILYFVSDGRMFWSAINDALSIAALDYIEAEGRPDGLVGGIVLGNDIWLFGSDSAEVWGLTDNAVKPFARLGGAAIEQGCIAAASIVKVQVPGGTRLAWVANDKTVRMSEGYLGARISTHTVERAIAKCADATLIESFSYNLDGHVFLVLNAPEWTWVYNATTTLWHEEQTYGSVRRTWQRSMIFAKKTLVGDRNSSRIYEVSNDVMDDAGTPLVCTVITPQDHAYPNDIEYNRLYLDTLPGTGLNVDTPDLANPQVSIQWSFDGGENYGSSRLLSTGAVGQTTKRVVTDGLGTSYEDGAVFKIQWSPAVARAITGAAVDSTIIRA